ncbi:MAG: hypothetical protein LBF12_01600 [Christensenellaceae bacterium]|jgi:hypothetical protein|nr:hypothetical protein [Christensenellaceae bacterium]
MKHEDLNQPETDTIKSYAKFEMSEELHAKIIAEIAGAKAITKTRDRDIAERIGKSHQAYSAMVSYGLSKLGTVEAIANALGFRVKIEFIPKDYYFN